MPCTIVAIAALHKPFVHAMMEGHLELRLLLQVAGVAKLGLCLDQQEFPASRHDAASGRRCSSRHSVVCSELTAFMCSVPPAWQVRQRSLISLVE